MFTSDDAPDASAAARAQAAAAAAVHSDVALAICDASASAGNRALATKVKLAGYPALAARATKGGGLRVVPLVDTDVRAEIAKLSAATAPPPQQPQGASAPAPKRSPYEPPSKHAKAGATRAFPGKGQGVFWPRMPCLRCGCPWWSGEDWDARCVRCGWCCESEGYDNDSQPLERGGWRARFDAFSAHLREGRVAPWPPK